MPLLVQQIHRLPRRKHVHLFPVRTSLPSWREPVFACAFVPTRAACRTQDRVTTVYCLRRVSFATAGRGVPHPRLRSGVARLWSGVALSEESSAPSPPPLAPGAPGVDDAHTGALASAVEGEPRRNAVTVEQAPAGSRRRGLGTRRRQIVSYWDRDAFTTPEKNVLALAACAIVPRCRCTS